MHPVSDETTTTIRDPELCNVQHRYAFAWRNNNTAKPGGSLSEIIPLTSYLGMHSSINNPSPPLRCDVCDVTATSQEHLDTHMKGARHTRKVTMHKADVQLKQRFHDNDAVVQIAFAKWKCEPCGAEMCATTVINHMEGHRHRTKLRGWLAKRASRITCTVCNLLIDENQFSSHSQSKHHLNAVAAANRNAFLSLSKPAPASSSAVNTKKPRCISANNSSAASHSSHGSGVSKLNAFAKEFKPTSPNALRTNKQPVTQPKNDARYFVDLFSPKQVNEKVTLNNGGARLGKPSPFAQALKSGSSATDSSAANNLAARRGVKKKPAPKSDVVEIKNARIHPSGETSPPKTNVVQNDTGSDLAHPSSVANSSATVAPETVPNPSSLVLTGAIPPPEASESNLASPPATAVATSLPAPTEQQNLNPTNVKIGPLSVSSTFTFEILPSASLQDPKSSRLRAAMLGEQDENDENDSQPESSERSAIPRVVNGTTTLDVPVVLQTENYLGGTNAMVQLDYLPSVARNARPPVAPSAQTTAMAVDDATMAPHVNSVRPTSAIPVRTRSPVVQQGRAYTAHSPVRMNATNNVNGDSAGNSSRSGGSGSGGGGSQRSDRSQYYCVTCSVQCNANAPFQEHLRSARHLRMAGIAGSPPLKKKKGNSAVSDVNSGEQFSCEICNVVCNGANPLQEHFRSLKHVRKLEALKKQGTSSSSIGMQEKPRIMVTTSTTGATRGSVGPTVKKVKNEEKKCNLCDVNISGEDNFMAHLLGKSHQRRLRQLSDAGESVPVEFLAPQPAATVVQGGQ